MIDHCTDPAHTTVTVTEGEYARCGDCGRRLREGDPRLELCECACDGCTTGRNHCDRASCAQPSPIGPAASPPADIYDATSPPGVTQLPAVTTSMTPAQFKEWLASDGTLFMVILPANRTFVIKVPTAHHEFFVAMMQQVRFALGPEVQAVRMNMVTGPGADVDAATGKADDAPQWAQPDPPTEHLLTSRNECPICDAQPDHHCVDFHDEPLRDVNGRSVIHPARNMAARPAAEQENDR